MKKAEEKPNTHNAKTMKACFMFGFRLPLKTGPNTKGEQASRVIEVIYSYPQAHLAKTDMNIKK
jgi:hypothetical protein